MTSDRLKELVRVGEVVPIDLVWKEGMADWVPAGRLRRLFPDPPTLPEAPDSKEQSVTSISDSSIIIPEDGRETDRPWSANTIIVGLALTFVLPAGLWLTWRHRSWSQGRRLLLTTVAAAAVTAVVASWTIHASTKHVGFTHATTTKANMATAANVAQGKPSQPAVPATFQEELKGEWVGVDDDVQLKFENGQVIVSFKGISRFQCHCDSASKTVKWKLKNNVMVVANLKSDGRLYSRQIGLNHIVVFGREWKGGIHHPGEVDKGDRSEESPESRLADGEADGAKIAPSWATFYLHVRPENEAGKRQMLGVMNDKVREFREIRDEERRHNDALRAYSLPADVGRLNYDSGLCIGFERRLVELGVPISAR